MAYVRNVRDGIPARRASTGQSPAMDRLQKIIRSFAKDAAPAPYMTWPKGQYRIVRSGDHLRVEQYMPNLRKWDLSLTYPASQYRFEEGEDAWRLYRTDPKEAAPRDPQTMSAADRYRAGNARLHDELHRLNAAARVRWGKQDVR